MKKTIIYISLTIGFVFLGLTFFNNKVNSGEIQINWQDNLTGDFSFTKNWDYPEGVYKNDFGQLSCDGLCPPEIEKMQDEAGKIYNDSLKSYYKLVDTTHQFHSIQSEALVDEWAGTNLLTATKLNADSTVCITQNNAATHSSLILTITKNKCIPVIELNSVSEAGTKIVTCKSGQIEIDKNLWAKGVLKANFNFIFNNKENAVKEMYWKGKILTEIKSK